MRNSHARIDWAGRTFDVQECDVLVLGCGAAGYQAATAAARSGARVRIVGLARGASPFILGFNTSLPDGDARDSPQQFVADTFSGGYELADPSLVAALAEEAPVAFRELLALGVPFEMHGGHPALRHLSGSRYPRSVYVPQGTGNAVLRVITAEARRLGVAEHLGLKVLALRTLEGRVMGALALDQRTGRLTLFVAGNTVLAMGGIGGIYHDSTYPLDVEGGSYALALDVGATLRDMEFVQFEPTVVATPTAVRGMEMPTAMIGDGAILKNTLGERFMCAYNPGGCEKQIEKAKMALFIQKEIDEGRGTANQAVYFDATVLPLDCLQGYVSHYQRLLRAGVDPHVQPVEIHPAAHSLMGGVRIDARCHSDVPGLLVCGEAAGGLHGASRIAGNGAADAITFGRVAGLAACEGIQVPDVQQRARLEADTRGLFDAGPEAEESALVRRDVDAIAQVMSASFGIRRSAAGMLAGLEQLQTLYDAICDGWSGSPLHMRARARGVALVALTIARSAALREESRGAHYRVDFPAADDAHWKRSILVQLSGAGVLEVQ